LLQVAYILFPILQVPDWSLRLLVGLLALGFPVALVLAWAYNITPDGIERENDAPSAHAAQRGTRRRSDIIIGVLAASDKWGQSRNSIFTLTPFVHLLHLLSRQFFWIDPYIPDKKRCAEAHL